MKTDVDSRPQAENEIAGVAHQLAETAKQELHRFQGSVQKQITAIEHALSRVDLAEPIDRLVRDFSKVAIEQVEVAVSQARREAVEQAEQQIHTIQDKAAIDLETLRIESQARLGEELRSRTALADSLEVARQDGASLKGELDACRRDLMVAEERVRTLEEVRTRLEAEAEQHALATRRSAATLAVAPLERLETALERLGATSSARGLLDVLLEHLAGEFARAALFATGTDHFKVWKARGVDETMDGVAVPVDVDSPLKHALADQRPATLEPDAGTHAVGPFGSPVGSAIALPLFANGRIIAVAYGENSPEHPREATDVGFKMAELLVNHVNQRLVGRRSGLTKASAPDEDPRATAETKQVQFSPARQVSRIKMQAGTEVLVDGATSVLVDLSTAGAQILSPSTMRPNHPVRMLLPREGGGVACKGRVVWALLERSKGSTDARYRAGVTFTETDESAIEALLIQYGIVEGHA